MVSYCVQGCNKTTKQYPFIGSYNVTQLFNITILSVLMHFGMPHPYSRMIVIHYGIHTKRAYFMWFSHTYV